MERPQKKFEIIGQPEIYGYNLACDNWETYLKEVASVDNLAHFLFNRNVCESDLQEMTEKDLALKYWEAENLAKGLNKLIMGEE